MYRPRCAAPQRGRRDPQRQRQPATRPGDLTGSGPVGGDPLTAGQCPKDLDRSRFGQHIQFD